MVEQTAESAPEQPDLVLAGGRVIDPASGLDAVRDVAIRGGRIISVTGPGERAAAPVVDISGAVLSPGFIDLHSHAQSQSGLRMQALDGVTTALELEAGALPVRASYEEAAATGRPVNFGYSASWALARMRLFDGLRRPGPSFAAFQEGQSYGGWRRPADPRGLAQLLDLLEQEIHDGALGIGVLLGYAPDTGRSEYLALATLAARLGVPTFTHTRYISGTEPHSSVEGALETIAAAAGTGAHMHMCHLNSSSNRMIEEIATAVDRSRAYGLRVTTEAYPYGSASTVVGAAFLAPDQLHRHGIGPENLLFLPTGERIASAERLRQLRASDPGGLVIFDWLDESDPADLAVLHRSLLLEDTAIATDAMPLVDATGAMAADVWPVPAGAYTHPRSVGCYARTFGWLVRELGLLSLPEAVRRCTLLPASILSEVAPAMRRKGRIEPGADADLVVFDPDTIASPATPMNPWPSTGIRHVLVGGTFVVRDGAAVPDALPGQPIRSHRE